MTSGTSFSSGQGSEGLRSEPLALCILAVGAVVAGGSALCWAVAQLSLLLSGGMATDASLQQAPRFTSLVLRTRDPAAA